MYMYLSFFHSLSPPHSLTLSLSLSVSLSPQLPDTVNQELYSDSQLQVLAIIGLSELVSASYAEDTYGVVQRVRNIIHYMYMPSTS